MEDYYAILHLPSCATEEEIRQSFNSKAKHFHPDKIKQRITQQKLTLNETKYYQKHKNTFREEFETILRAYTVLTSPILRPIYDEFGLEGLEFAEQTVLKQNAKNNRNQSQRNVNSHSSSSLEQTEVGFHTPASIRVMQSVREAIQTRNQTELMGRLSAHTSVQMAINVDHIFDAKKIPTSLTEILNGLDVPQLVMQTSIGGHVTDQDQCTLSGYVVTRDGLGFGDLQFNWRRVWQPGILWSTANVALPFSKMFAVTMTRVIDQETGHQVSLGGSMRRGETGLTVSTSRRVTKSSTASLEWKIGREGGVSFSYDTKNKKNNSSTSYTMNIGDMEQGGSMGLGVTYKKVLADQTSTIRTGLTLGSESIEIFGGHTRRLSQFSRLGATLALSLTGVVVKIKYKRGETEFIIPIRISKSTFGLENPAAILIGGLFEGFIWSGMEWMLGPSKKKEMKRVQFEIGENVRKYRKIARKQQKILIIPTNQIITRENNTIHGLIIIEARYGTQLTKKYPWSTNSVDDTIRRRRNRNRNFDGDENDEDEDDSDSDDENEEDDVVRGMETTQNDGYFYPPNIDVRIPLQYLVQEDHTLSLRGDVTKSKMLGFCNPSIEPNVKSKLYIKYSYGGQVYDIVLNDTDEVQLPTPLANEVLGAEYLSYRHWFQPPSHLKGNRLIEWEREHPIYEICRKIDRQKLALRMLRDGRRNGVELENAGVRLNYVRHGGDGNGNNETKSGDVVMEEELD